MNEALAVLSALLTAAKEIGDMVREAQAQGRELTADELTAVRDRRKAAEAAFDAELERRRQQENRT